MPSLSCLMFIMNLVGCLCIREEKYHVDLDFGNKMWPTKEVEFERRAHSVLHCVRVCSTEYECHSLVYYNGTNTCYGIKSANPSTGWFALPGAVFYKPVSTSTTTTKSPTTSPTVTEVPTTTTMTVTQTCGTTTNITGCGSPFQMLATVNDSQLSASSEYDSDHGPHHARLNGDEYWQYWSSKSSPVVGEYIQVDFLSLRVATAVIIEGHGNELLIYFDQRITSFTISTSIDCVTFCAILDIDGTEQVFPGNPDQTSLVTNNLEPPVSARCLRINPQTWNEAISMRFEVMGCLP